MNKKNKKKENLEDDELWQDYDEEIIHSFIAQPKNPPVYNNPSPPELWIAIDKNVENYVDHVYNSAKENSGNIIFHIICDKSVSSLKVNEYVKKGYIIHTNPDISYRINFNPGRLPKTMYYRWLIPYLTFSDKAIYVDIDVVILGNLNDLWNIDLKENYIAAVPDSYYISVYDAWHIHQKSDIKVSAQSEFKNIRCFFSGQLVINCKLWRKDNITEKLIDFANKYKTYDMVALSVVCKDRIYSLPKEWCVSGKNYFIKGKMLGKRGAELIYDKTPYKSPLIIHWHGIQKPWNYKNYKNMQRIYFLKWYRRYARVDKYVLLGSAPYAKDYWYQVREYYFKNNYKLLAINNAWAIDPDNLEEWFFPEDFEKYGTLMPTEEDKRKFKFTCMSDVVRSLKQIESYNLMKKSTMALNVFYLMWHRYKDTNKCLELVVIGSDFQYDVKNPSFYKPNPNKVHYGVRKMLSENAPKLKEINADPLRFGKEWLIKQLQNVKEIYEREKFYIYVDTPLEKTLLPFERKKEIKKYI